MCGITGFSHLRKTLPPGVLTNAVDSITHRGPNQKARFECDEVSLGATRLAILDLASGDQPIFSADRDAVIVYNGEVFNFVELREGFLQYLPIGALIGLVLFIELIFVFGAWEVASNVATAIAAPQPATAQVTNTAALGELLYTRYIYAFQAAGMILLVAMIGAIVLTLRPRQDVRRQKIAEQVARKREATLELVKIRPRQGV